jgi:hypothetical protein
MSSMSSLDGRFAVMIPQVCIGFLRIGPLYFKDIILLAWIMEFAKGLFGIWIAL